MPLDPTNFLSYSVWLSLKFPTRYKIADLFGITPRGIRQVVDSTVVSDGFIHSDLAAITKERMQEITGLTSQDFYVLFQALVDHVENPPQDNSAQQEEQAAETRPGATGKTGRAKKGNKPAAKDSEGAATPASG